MNDRQKAIETSQETSKIWEIAKRAARSIGGGTSAVWGSITGTLSDQTDLNTQLGLKATSAQLATHAGLPDVHHARAHAVASASDHSDWPSGLDATELGYVNGVTSSIQPQLDTAKYEISGFANRTDSTISLSTRTVTVAPAVTNFVIYSNGVPFTKTGGATCETTVDATVGLHYIYFDTSGVLQHSMSAWTLPTANVPVALVYWNGAAGVIFDERHSAWRGQGWHAWAHDTIGTRYETGLEGTFASGTTTITDGYIHDEDIDYHITQQTSVRIWYRGAGATAMTFDASGVTYCAKIVTGALKYDNAGTVTDVDPAKYVCNWVYATAEKDLPIMVVVGQAQYSTLATARVGTLPSFPNTPTKELKLLYRTIWQNVGGTPTYVENQDYRAASTLPAGGTPTIAAAGVSFTPSGSVAATNVQAAIEELDTEKVIPANEAGAANNFLTAYNNATGAWTKARPTWANVDKATSDIADITTKSHTSLSDKGTLTHALIDTQLSGLDVVGGRVEYGSTTQLSWLPWSSNMIRLFSNTDSDFRVCIPSSAPTLANTANDMNGDAATYGVVYDVFAKYVSATSFTLEIAKWATTTARTAAWLTSTAYKIGQRVSNSGSYYGCIVAHTSGTFATDLADGKWALCSHPRYSLGSVSGIPTYGDTGVWRDYRWLGLVYLYNDTGAKFRGTVNSQSIGNFYNPIQQMIRTENTTANWTYNGAALQEFNNGTGQVKGTYLSAFQQSNIVTLMVQHQLTAGWQNFILTNGGYTVLVCTQHISSSAVQVSGCAYVGISPGYCEVYMSQQGDGSNTATVYAGSGSVATYGLLQIFR